ncbi:hypothetical protein KSP40_PGU002406 [Platanthera guangdongensis]|uniref:SUN domain-containing protein n=1 Tax=Platanthera guangdongensis TaxID=2320717 RepID=A0ABR2MCK5_9ASPA
MNSSPNTNNSVGLVLDQNLTPHAKRRSAIVMERTSKSTLLSDGGVNGVNNDRVISNRKDLSHTIRGETVLDRTRDLSQLKKGVIAAPIPSKRRRSIHRQAKPLWQTVLSCLTKNLLLLAALLYVGQVIWRWTGGVVGINSSSPFAALDSDSRISEVESSLKRTAKLLQVQLDAVDKRIVNEVGVVTKELTKQIEEKGTVLEKELKNLEARTDDLGNSLSQLKDEGLVSKIEFEKFLDELKSKRSLDDHNDVDLDHIRALAKDIVDKEIEKHAADGLGRVDYALASGGARVVKHSQPYAVVKASSWLAVTKVKSSVHPSAQKMLEPSFGEPGQCFPLQGSSGFVEIRLRVGIIPDSVTLEHVSKAAVLEGCGLGERRKTYCGLDEVHGRGLPVEERVSPSTALAPPKDCRVSGWFEGPEDDPSTRAEKMAVLTEFSYDLEGTTAQTFSVPIADSRVINMVRLDFTSNHGNAVHTCIYRFRVHGFEPSFPPAMAAQP